MPDVVQTRKIQKSRSHFEDKFARTHAGQRILTVSEEQVKSFGRVFNEQLSDKNQEAAIRNTTKEGLDAINKSLLPGKFKVWLYQFVLLPRLFWPLIIFKIGLPYVQSLEGIG